MKKLSSMLLALAGLFILAGCSDSPRYVTVKWAKAIVDGDVKKANEYTTEKTRPINGIMVGVLSADDENGKTSDAANSIFIMILTQLYFWERRRGA